MQGWTWKNSAAVAAVMLALVVIIYAVNWNATYGFNDNIGDAFFRALSAFFLFEWVKDYQTLLGGVFAVFAASTIFINSAFERRARDQEREEIERRAMRSDIAKLCTLLRNVTVIAFANGDPKPVWTQLEIISSELASFARYAPILTTRLQYYLGQSQTRVRQWAEHCAKPTASQQVNELRYFKHAVVAYVELARLYLSDNGRVERDDVASAVEVNKWEAERLVWTELREADRVRILRDVKFLDD